MVWAENLRINVQPYQRPSAPKHVQTTNAQASSFHFTSWCAVTKGFIFGLPTSAKDIFLFTRACAVEFRVEWNAFDNIRPVFHKADGLFVTVRVMQVLAINRHAQGT